MRKAEFYQKGSLDVKFKKSVGLWGLYGFLVLLGACSFFIFQFFGNIYALRIEAGPTQANIISLWKIGAYSDIISHLEEEIKNDPLDPTKLVLLGFSHFYQGLGYGDDSDKKLDMELAISYLRKALLFSSVPTPDRVYYILGKSYYHKGLSYFDLAIKYLKKALSLNPNLYEVYEYLGLIYENLSQYSESYQSFYKAYSYHKTSLNLYALSYASFQKGDILESKNNLLKLEEKYLNNQEDSLKPDDNLIQNVWILLGDIMMRETHYDQSMIYYQKVISLNSSNAKVYLKLGDLYDKKDQDRVKARKFWRKSVELDPQLKEAMNRLNQPSFNK